MAFDRANLTRCRAATGSMQLIRGGSAQYRRCGSTVRKDKNGDGALAQNFARGAFVEECIDHAHFSACGHHNKIALETQGGFKDCIAWSAGYRDHAVPWNTDFVYRLKRVAYVAFCRLDIDRFGCPGIVECVGIDRVEHPRLGD
jgi:hypothetical protein